jgi:hypothetical protein
LDEKLEAKKYFFFSYTARDVLNETLDCGKTIRQLLIEKKNLKSPTENWTELKQNLEGKLLKICKKLDHY